ncbi:hypothetical protein OG896_14840 [Streptomyces sp. NBC_00669]|uniref:hypothetical protein n=1 Tax=Streptomyces sp. NBC_00669 TaxID=2976011 RepID=UPI002E3147C9|nr:hypothetical protein [Streptomyces sp. NBC_00669]
MVRISSGVAAAGFLAAALATVGMLTAAAVGAPPRHHPGAAPGRTATSAPGSAASPDPAPTALPAGSGHGARVVYSLGRHRVWLVDAHEGVLRTYGVRGGTVAPARGTHRVFAREGGEVVLFASTNGANVGFGSSADAGAGAGAPGAVMREAPSDAAALWRHAPMGSLVAVVP